MHILLDLFITSVVGVVGLICGWLLHRNRPVEMTVAPGSNPELSHAREAIARLQELATRVASDVGQHSQQVGAISEEIVANKSQGSDFVEVAVTKLVEANQSMQQRLAEAEVKLQEQAWLVESHAVQARTDALTGLGNRRAFADELARLSAGAAPPQSPLGMVMLDIDHFKMFNDTFGHLAGDEVIKGVGGAIRETVGTAGFAARYGGEEFSVLLPGRSRAEIEALAEKIRQTVERSEFHFAGKSLRVTVSVGAATLLPGELSTALVERADRALYGSKAAGRNCVHWHDGQQVVRVSPPLPAPAPRAPAKAPEPVEAADDQDCFRSGLANRTAFCMAVKHQMGSSTSDRSPWVILIEIDHYAEFVGRFGDEAMGSAVDWVADQLRECTRPGDQLAQFNERTFAVMLSDADRFRALLASERLRQVLGSHTVSAGVDTENLTVSMGLCTTVSNNEEIMTFMRRVEDAIDASRRAGGDCAYLHDGRRAISTTAVLQMAQANKAKPVTPAP